MGSARYSEGPAPAGSGLACVWTHELPAAAEEPYLQTVVPDGCVDLIWWARGGGVTVAGPDTGPHPALLEPGDLLVGVRFAPGAAPGALGVPADAVRDGRVPLRELWGAEAERLAEEIAATGDPAGTLARAVLERTQGTDPLVPAMLEGLRTGTVRQVADDLGLGERQLRRRATAAFGYGPKILQRVLRFQRALRLARAGRPFAEVACETGYADQAHMANEVRALSGTSLRTLL